MTAADSEHVPAFTVVVTQSRWHALKVEPPYFDAIFDGDKTFEVRRNDRAFQRGDSLRLREWHPAGSVEGCHTCENAHWRPHYTDRECVRRVSFVYSGDPRFGGVEPGHVVLALANDGGEARAVIRTTVGRSQPPDTATGTAAS